MPDDMEASTPSFSDNLEAETVVPSGQNFHPSHGMHAPTIIGNYRIVEEIARGGMGVVYLAQHLQISRQVAIKTVLIETNGDTETIERFSREAEAVARLNHPGIVTIYEVGQHEGLPYIAMQYVDRGCLSNRMQEGPLSCNDALDIALRVSEAMSHAHENGIIHRDLKPANILLDSNRLPVVTDFGIAKYVESTKCELTRAGQPIGTPHYMPPEQADPTYGEVGGWSDVYSIGAMMYAMLTGRPPFQAATAIDVIFQMLSNDPVPPRRLNSTVPATLEAIVLKCLQKQPKERYQSASELANDLKHFRDGKPTIAKPVTGVRMVAYQLRKHFMLATVSGSIVTLLILATAIVLIAHVRLLDRNFQLELEKDELANVLGAERNLFRMRMSSLRNEDVSDTELAAERLAFYASNVQGDNIELAARLALESIRQSRRASLPEAPASIDILRRYLESHQSNLTDGVVVSHDDAESRADLVSRAEKTSIGSLSDEQKRLFGLSPQRDELIHHEISTDGKGN